MKRILQQYREELWFLAAELVLMYGVTRLYAVLYQPFSWDYDILIYIPPAAAFLSVAVYSFRNRSILFPLVATVLLSLGLGLAVYEPPRPGALISFRDWMCACAGLFAMFNFLSALIAVILGNLCGFAADKIQEKLQKNISE